MLPDNPSDNSYARHIAGSIVNLLANYFPYFIVIIILIGFSAAFYVNRLDYAVRGSIIGIPALLAAYSMVKTRTQEKLDGDITLFSINTYVITSLFIIFYLFSICSVIISPTRPWYYFVLIACLLLSLRIKDKVVINWLSILLKFNLRPQFYVFNKNDIYQRDVFLPAVKKTHGYAVLKKETKVTSGHISKDLIKLKRYLRNPNYALSLKPNKKGGLYVALNQIQP